MSRTHETLDDLFNDIAISIQEKTGDDTPIVADDFPEAIDEIPTGGGGKEPSVFFLDYDGTIIETWDDSSVAGKTALPDNPTHEGLVAQGWNWDLQHIKDYIATYDNSMVYVGQMYKTASGLTEIDVVMDKVTGKTIICNMVGNKNWGDGTTDNLTTHTYADYGEYTITCDGTTIPEGSTSSGGMFSSYSNNINRYWCSAIRLGEGVTSIGAYGFQYCYSLTNITIPQGVTSIGDNAFYSCYSFTNVTIPQGVRSIGAYAFEFCYSLTNVVIPQGVTSIGQRAFQNCCSLTNITIPQGVTSIGDSAFYSCYSFTNVTIPQGVRSIGAYAFEFCYSLTNVVIPQGVTSIGDNAFYSCYSFTNVTIPQGVTSINKNAFYNCYSLTNVVIPQGVTSIGDNAFYGCRALKACDFTSATTIPTLSATNALGNINGQCKILVPSALYDDWITSTNWSTYADYIYAV